ncbi:hypothetical protein A8M32_07075 [Sinorhizobium alkalisoli]|uniref:Potassium channel domain-containing protein n=2 Tax=Sinorhizobium alkalisoli TaxID=1752398 RepID=A0A1E3VFW6_9HYPH|nr:hypothetical protein A8M32_07075 [Sinorhizobium alkalisoli]
MIVNSAMSIINAYLRLVERWRWSLLLTLLIATFLLQPLWSHTRLGELANVTLYLLVFGGAVHAGRIGATSAVGVIALLSMALALQVLSTLGIAGLDGPLLGLMLVIVVSALIATFAELVGSREMTTDSLAGAIFGYFMIATAWALLYLRLEAWQAGSFRIPNGGDLDMQLLYFSLVTITTVGYGDITPATPTAQVLSVLEAAIGTLYIAILIGRIVGQFKFGEKRVEPECERSAMSFTGQRSPEEDKGAS